MNRQYGALSGVAIFLIVVNHAIHFGLQVSPVEGGWLKLLVVLQALGVFAVPMFLFVSGAFLAYAAREFSASFVRSSLERILWPYLIWSGGFYTLLYTVTGESYPVTDYLKNLVVGYPYHFVPLLVFWYLATPMVVWLGRRHGVVLLAGIAVYQAWLLAVRFPGMFGLEGVLPRWAAATAPPILFTTMSEWAVYFPLGMVITLNGAVLKPRLAQWRRTAATATVVVFGLGLLNAFGSVEAPWARFAAPLPLMFLLPTIDRASIPWLDTFERLGRRSYGIYLAHFVAVNGVAMAARGLVPSFSQPFIVFPAFLLVAFGVSLFVMDALSRPAAGRRVYRYVFGIVPPPIGHTS